MIKSIDLTYFRKHESLSITLSEGLQTLRGNNESGKTSLLESAAYALFGSKALRNSLSDTVTWGHKETELKVSVVISLGGQDFKVTRGKSGAEVIVDGKVFVTGQTEVSAFFADLLGADVNVAHHLMLAGQGGLRGVLEQGPKATSNLIETLSDLDVIDRIIDAAQANLTLGSTAVLSDRLKYAEEALSNVVEPVAPVAPDLREMQTELVQAQAELVTAVAIKDSAGNMFSVESQKREQRDQLVRDLASVKAQAQETSDQIAAEQVKAGVDVPDPAPVRALLAAAEDRENTTKAWGIFQGLREPEFRITPEAFDKLRVRIAAELVGWTNTISNCKQSLKHLEPQAATSHNCPACGQDTAHLAHVKAKQAEIAAEIEACKASLAKATDALPEATENQSEVDALISVNTANLALARKIAAYVTIDETMFPVTVIWKGLAVSDVATDIPATRRQLAEIEAAITAKTKAQAKVEALTEVLAASQKRCVGIETNIAALALVPDAAFNDLTNAFLNARQDVEKWEGRIAINQICLESSERTYKDALAVFEREAANAAALKTQVSTLKSDIEATEFHNGLVKKVRAARPIIANKLWNLVLATVSTLFSQMRGEPSVVVKDSDGFKVNGKAVESLSGSTLDLLGLSMRCALVRTFIPNCSFLVLDEPASACDSDREAAMLGYVASAGFKQVILVTHSSQSDALSNNLIQL